MKIGPKYKICRRLGDNVFPQCQTTKFSISGSNTKAKGGGKSGGRGGKGGARGKSDYGVQLIEKQKARYTYGVNERQFRNYVESARHKVKTGNPAPQLYQLLERRLDNVVFRAGWASSRAFGRQVVSHGHILVNGKRVTIPSLTVGLGDVVTIRKQSLTKPLYSNLDERLKDYVTPKWLLWNEANKTLAVKALPVFGEQEANLNFNAILEFYSRV